MILLQESVANLPLVGLIRLGFILIINSTHETYFHCLSVNCRDLYQGQVDLNE